MVHWRISKRATSRGAAQRVVRRLLAAGCQSHKIRAAPVACLAIVGLAVLAPAGCATHSTKRQASLSKTHVLLAQDYLQKKNPEGAKQELFKALKVDPESEDAHRLLGIVFFLEGVHAMNFVDRTQCLKGSAATEQRELASAKFRDAEKHLLRSLGKAKEDAQSKSDTLNYLANVALHFGRYDQAITYATRAADSILYTSRYMALGTRGWSHFKKGQHALAARDLRQALFHQPKFCVGRFRLAKVYYARGEYQQAAAELEKVVVDKACTFQDPSHLLGLVYTKLHRTDMARKHFNRCVTRNPKSCLSLECQRYGKLIDSRPRPSIDPPTMQR